MVEPRLTFYGPRTATVTAMGANLDELIAHATELFDRFYGQAGWHFTGLHAKPLVQTEASRTPLLWEAEVAAELPSRGYAGVPLD